MNRIDFRLSIISYVLSAVFGLAGLIALNVAEASYSNEAISVHSNVFSSPLIEDVNEKNTDLELWPSWSSFTVQDLNWFEFKTGESLVSSLNYSDKLLHLLVDIPPPTSL